MKRLESIHSYHNVLCSSVMPNTETKTQTQSTQVSKDLKERAQKYGVRYKEFVRPNDVKKDVLFIIPEETARRFNMATIARNEADNTIEIIATNPQNIQGLNVLRFLAKKTGERFEVFLVNESTLQPVLALYESAERALKDVVRTIEEDKRADVEGNNTSSEDTADTKILKDAPVAKLVEVVVRHAIEGKASDIHIEPAEKEYRVRYRVDGVLHHSLTLPKNVGQAVVARVKILAVLKIDEKRKPQDGRFHFTKDKNRIDFRVSTFPVIEGEKVVMRVLDKNRGLGDLKTLGLMGKSYDIFNERIHDPYGIILITGPTGSGKSTTLYGFLRILNTEDTNIVTLEDPVEYFIEGINQSQVRPDIGYTFANGLRSILRQDPNVIMVGEIRDGETAELAIHSALTGHLVFSTLHTNDAIGAIPRLLDMGVEAFLLAAAARAVAAQRLVRRICEHCKQKAHIPKGYETRIQQIIEGVDPAEIKKYGLASRDRLNRLEFYEGKGCEECSDTGYKGRVAIYEVFEINRDVQDFLGGSEHVSDAKLHDLAEKQHMITIKQDGIFKALLGYTTLAEVDRVTEGEVLVGGDMTDDTG